MRLFTRFLTAWIRKEWHSLPYISIHNKENRTIKQKQKNLNNRQDNRLFRMSYSGHIHKVVDVVEPKWKGLEGQNHSLFWCISSDNWVTIMWSICHCRINTCNHSQDHFINSDLKTSFDNEELTIFMWQLWFWKFSSKLISLLYVQNWFCFHTSDLSQVRYLLW